MKKITLFLFMVSFIALNCFAQPAVKLKKTLELKMPKTIDDEMPGTRGAAVAWHPLQKKYYAVFAGNMGYPLAVFDAKATRISGDEQTAMIDTRGLWYNPTTNKITGNAYNNYGWFTYKIGTNGLATDYESIAEGMFQPNMQSVGVYNPIEKRVLFLNGSMIMQYNANREAVDSSTVIHWGRKKAEGAMPGEDMYMTPEEYNTTPVYTGIKGRELAFINITNKQIELYDAKTGFLTSMLALPEDVATEPFFNFAYANNIYWLFDIKNRTWIGYK